MTPTIDLTQADIMTAVGNYLTALFPTLPIIQGQLNRIAEPGAPDFVVFTPTLRNLMGTAIVTWQGSNPSVAGYSTGTQITVQCDVHGPASTDNAQILFTLFRSENATQAFAATGFSLAPLYASDPVQLPFFNSEDQYEDRWTVDLVMQASPVVTASQDFASTLKVTLEAADA
jgi:hypothetical protein